MTKIELAQEFLEVIQEFQKQAEAAELKADDSNILQVVEWNDGKTVAFLEAALFLKDRANHLLNEVSF